MPVAACPAAPPRCHSQQWGHDFRPDYKCLSKLKHNFPDVPLMALTATATEAVRLDVCTILQLRSCVTFTSSFNRPNLWYHVQPKRKNCAEDIAATIKAQYANATGIVYCCSRRDCEEVAAKLRAHNVNASHYHADIDPEERKNVQKAWMNDEIRVICATIAFGMGINKPDVCAGPAITGLVRTRACSDGCPLVPPRVRVAPPRTRASANAASPSRAAC